MKKEIMRLLALLIFGAATLTSCSVQNRNHRGPNDHNRHHDDRRHNGDRDSHYYNH